MKPVITKEEVGKAMDELARAGKKSTLAAIHAALGNRGSMPTLVRLKSEIDGALQQPTDSPEALEAFRKVWSLGREDGRRGQEQMIYELRETAKVLAFENEKLEGMAAAAQRCITEMQVAKSNAEADLTKARIELEKDLKQATSTMHEAGLQAAKAMQDLADARASHATELAALHADLKQAHRKAHDFELELVRAQTLLKASGRGDEGQSPTRS